MNWDNLLLFLASLVLFHCSQVEACPTNRTLYSFCKCDSSFNGVLLDCSNVDAIRTLRVLRENQAQLGLVQQLIIQNTSLRDLSPQLFKGLYIKKLDLSMNQIENISRTAFEGLENILQSLVMQKNQLKQFPVEALEGMAALLHLDFSNNSIGDLDGRQALRNTPKLYDLSLADNKICNIHKTVFDEVKHSVQTLNLGGNCLDKVPAAALRGFKQLLALHLHSNKIQQLEPLQFMNLPLLNLINLARNSISSVHRQTFLNVPNLRLMYLTENNISEITPQQFLPFEALEMLDLTRNHIKMIPTGAFSNMTRLAQLYLGENQIDTIEPNAFSNSSITILLLPKNKLTSLNQEMFQWMSYIQQLNLKDNQIKEMAQNTFYHMPSLVMLDMSGNELRLIPPATFLTQLNMFLVDLSKNNIVATPYNAFNKRAMTVILQENPLVCTERVHMLQNGVGVYVPGTVDKICGGVAAPPVANGQESSSGTAFVQDNSGSQGQQSGQRPPNARNNPNFPQRNTTTIFNPVVTPGPDFFTRRPLIRPAGPPNPIDPSSSNPTVSRFQPPNRGETLPNGGGAFGPPTGGLNGNRPQWPNPRQPPFRAPSPTIPPGQSVTVPVKAVPINIENPSPGPLTNFNRNNNNFPGSNRFPSNPVRPNSNRPNGNPQPPSQLRPPTRPWRGPSGEVPRNSGRPNPQPGQWTPPPGGFRPEARTIRPFPVPFLKNNPIRPAFQVTYPPTTTPEPTLPPGIITAGTHPNGLPRWTRPRPKIVDPSNPVRTTRPQPADGRNDGRGRTPGPDVPSSPARRPVRPGSNGRRVPVVPQEVTYPPTRNRKTTTRLPPSVRTVPPKKPSIAGGPDAAVAGDFGVRNGDEPANSAGSATTTIAVCLTVVVLVMIAVFITLCVVRHRNNTRRSESSASRTSAYVAAQAARVNYASNYQTASMARLASRNGGGGRPGQTWIYAPGTYAAPSNYY